MCEQEQQEYIAEMRRRHPDKNFTAMTFTFDGDDVCIRYEYEPIPFERIRRITGYLTGTLNRWNNAKRQEESDRVKHGMSEYPNP